MQPALLRPGDTIGIASPGHVAQPERYARIISRLKSKGFNVREGKNLYSSTYGYLASDAERAEDFNSLVCDPQVKLVFFGGGEGGLELMPLLDYDAIAKTPKLYLSYSDGTSILNAIHAETGLVTYYGQTPGEFEDLREYDWMQFESHLIRGDAAEFVKNSEWITLVPGAAEGELAGGYLVNYALLAGGEYLALPPDRKYLLFLEDHEMFSNLASVSMYLSHLEQRGVADNVSGLIFGHYSDVSQPDLLSRLRRFGERHGVPVVCCSDFGHGRNHAILPIGVRARLDADAQKLRFFPSV